MVRVIINQGTKETENMHTTIQLLPAVNNLYSLNLTKTQLAGFTSIANKSDNWKDTIEALNGSIWHFSLTDTILAFTSLDSLRDIQLRKVPTEKANKTITVINAMQQHKLSTCYVYSKTNRYDMPSPKSGFIFDSVSKKDVDKLDKLDFLVNLLFDRSCTFEGLQYMATIDDAIKFCKQHLLNNIEKFNRSSSNGLDTDTLKKLDVLLKYLWPTMSQAIIKPDEITSDEKEILNRHSEVGFMTYIGEADNHRFVIMKHGTESSNYNYYSRRSYDEWTFYIIPHTHAAYDYCDLRRFVYLDESSYETCIGKYIFLDELPAIPEKADILADCARIKKISKANIVLLTNDEINHAVKRYMSRQNRIKREADAKDRLKQKADDKIKILKETDGELKINDMIFTHSAIEYQGQQLKISSSTDESLANWPHVILKHLTRYQSITDIHFDTVLQTFVQLLRQYILDRKNEVSGKIGDVTFAVTHQESTNSRNITSVRWYINEKRINAKELEQVLERALCFETQIDYDNFLKSVSACSLFFHRYLQIGIDISVMDQFDHTTVTMKFPLERRKGKMFLVLNDSEFPVIDTHKLIRLSKKQSMLEVITTLLDGSAVRDVQADDIKQLIADGKQAYVDAVEKSKLLLKETEELFNIQAETMTINGKSKYGYKIEGGMRTYFLEKSETDDVENSRSCGVYDFHGGNYICIVDKSTSQVGQDKLVNRIFALHNDSRVAKHINTLTRKTQ
jgi:hypothetical protein